MKKNIQTNNCKILIADSFLFEHNFICARTFLERAMGSMSPGLRNKKHYLTDEQLEYFRAKLVNWRNELIRESDETRNSLSNDRSVEADFIDTACNIVNQSIELRTKDRIRKLIHKIEQAIQRVNDGTYGYCEDTGVPIGIKRLEARPIATLCIEAQERHERKERDYREDAVAAG